MMKSVWLLLLLVSSANACEYNLNGRVDYSTYRDLTEVIEKCPNQQIVVNANSWGGVAGPLLSMMDRINQHNRVVWVVEDEDTCASACAWMGIAASNIKGTLLFHHITRSDGRTTLDNYKLQVWLFQHRKYGFGLSQQLITEKYVAIEFK